MAGNFKPFNPKGGGVEFDHPLAPPLKAFSNLKGEPAVDGSNLADGDGVLGSGGIGVHGEGDGTGVFGHSFLGKGVFGTSDNNVGVQAETKSTTTAALVAYQNNPNSNTAALYAKHTGNQAAAYFEGNVVVTGDIILTNAADFAEDFDISVESSAEPGTVMVLDDDSELRESFRPYDKRVAGVVSGAGDYKPGIVLDKQQSESNRQPIALLGKVYCKVDAQYGSIEIGDLLTTSPTLGHAMKAEDQTKAFGSVIGKALRSFSGGQGLIPILIALQ